MKISSRIKWAIAVFAFAVSMFAWSVAGQDMPPMPEVPTSEPADPFTGLMNLLTGKWPWMAGALVWIGALRVCAKPISGWLQNFFTKVVAYVQGTPETDDDAWVAKILASKPYRFIGFIVDWIASIKLPNSDTLKALTKKVGMFLLCGLLSFGSMATLTGCQTAPTQESIQTYLLDARDIAELGTQAALLENAEFRDELETTRDALLTLAAVPQPATVNDLIAALSTLPLDQLQSDKGRIYVTGGRIILRRFSAFVDSQIDIGGGYVQQFAAAMAEGMTEGLK